MGIGAACVPLMYSQAIVLAQAVDIVNKQIDIAPGARLGKGAQVLLVAKAVSMAEFDHKEKVKTRSPIQVHGPSQEP